jgi:hypothetical protein
VFTIFVIVRDFIGQLLRPDLDTILAAFTKAQKKLSNFIDREETALNRETMTIYALEASRARRNDRIDRAYRTIHRLDTLVA